MKKNLGSYIIAAFVLNVVAIMSVGGVCILLVQDMVRNISSLERESDDVARIAEVSTRINRMIVMIHKSVAGPGAGNLAGAFHVLDAVKTDLQAYQTDERLVGMRFAGEMELIGEIQANLAEMRLMVERLGGKISSGRAMEPEEVGAFERISDKIRVLTDSVNRGHYDAIAGLVNESYEKMYFILFLYLVSSLVGIIASIIGYIVLSRHTIIPIKRLALATRSVAEGDLSTRVDTRSATEIGTLYESFNIMAERLQEHEKKREDFNRELEQKVKGRTSQLKAVNRSLQKAREELFRMEKIATLGQIATSVNHEIKTPLNSLYMNLQLLTRQIKKSAMEDEESRGNMLKVSAIIEQEISRISGILEEFVKYARFAPPELQKTDLNQLIRAIAGMISQSADKAKVEVDLRLSDQIGILLLDEKKMTQALLNLCVNAIQAMPEGGRLTMETARRKGDTVIRVSDTGKGISAEDLDRIFDPFFTRKEGGLGFGLPIVQRIIEDHKGRITCQSKPGESTVFEILLPGKYLS
jgi:signal transduction histidine kinase